MEEPVPEILRMGVFGRQLAGDGVASVAADGLSDEDDMVFCEGYAEGADGSLYAWEVMTRDWRGERAARIRETAPLARISLLGRGCPPVEILEAVDADGSRYTQTVVDGQTFGGSLIERMRTASDEDRARLFTRVKAVRDG